MVGLIKIAIAFTFMSAITLLIYLRREKKKRYNNLSVDTTSLLVYVLVIGFFLTSYIVFFLIKT